MGLQPGARLGSYELGGLVGAGGMGEVYRARDLRLNRDVAIKVLPESFASDPDRVARFKREAQLLASLNHPNIATIHGVEDSAGAHALVLELVDGVTLADRLAQGAMSVPEALPVALQLCAALDAAHERGIIHRDLKPGNIKLRPDGTIKVLDFGLAKALAPVSSEHPATLLTMTSPAMTAMGIMLGTAAYMSPEQAKGKEVDRRADIWSFGVVFYEMLAGHLPFRGETVSELLSAVLRDEPDWSALPHDSPPRVRWLLRRCLEKDPTRRLRDIGDARWELEQPPAAEIVPVRRGRPWLAWIAAAAFAVLAAAGWLTPRAAVPAGTNVALTISAPSGSVLSQVGGVASAPEISPDGKAVVFSGRGGLYVRRLDDLESKQVAGSGGLSNAFFWSADSTQVVIPTTTGQVVRVRVPDGPVQPLTQIGVPTRGGSWSENGTLLFAREGLLTVPSSGGDATPLAVPGMRPGRYLYPEFLPGAEDFLFLFSPVDSDEREIYLARFQDGRASDPVLLLKNETAARYTPAGGGRILFVLNDQLYAQRLNLQTRKVEGEPELLVAGVASQPGSQIYRGEFSVSRTGAIAWRPGKAALAEVTTFDRTGKPIGAPSLTAAISSMVLSADDTRLLAHASERSFVLDVGQPGRLALPFSSVRWFGWSPDGSKIIGLENQARVVERSVEGGGSIREIVTSSSPLGLGQDISRDGRTMLAMLTGGAGLMALTIDGSATTAAPVTLVHEMRFTASPRFSPDGRWILYEAGEPRPNTALYVQPYGRPGRRKPIGAAGRFPEWRRDGKEIVFNRGDEVWSLAVTDMGDDLRFGPAQRLFSGLRPPSGLTLVSRPLAVTRDGSRLFFPQAVEQPTPDVIHVYTAWRERAEPAARR